MSGRNVDFVATIPGKYALSVNDAAMATPEGWLWLPLNDVARLESGHTPSREHPEYWDGGVPWIGIRDARENHGQVITTTLQTITNAGLDNSAARLLPAGTVCLSRTASVGYVVVMGLEMSTSQDFVNWVCSDALDPHFLKWVLLAEGEDGLRKFGKGSTHTTIYFPEVKAFHICLPPRAEQERIVEVLDKLFARTARLRDRFSELLGVDDVQGRVRDLEQAILAKAFRGELVPQAQEDEPVAALVDRVRSARAGEPKRPRGRQRTTAPDEQNGASATNGHSHAAAVGAPVDLVVAALLARGRATSADVQDATGLDAADIRPVLKSLERLGKVAVEGKARGTAYRWLG